MYPKLQLCFALFLASICFQTVGCSRVTTQTASIPLQDNPAGDGRRPIGFLAISSTSVNPGEQITVTVSGGNNSVNQWVGLYVSGTADSTGSIDWQYLNGTQTAPTQPVSTPIILTFTAPTQPGVYNFRFFADVNPSGNSRIAVSTNFTVVAPTPTPTPTSSPTPTPTPTSSPTPTPTPTSSPTPTPTPTPTATPITPVITSILTDVTGATVNWNNPADRITFTYGNNLGVIQVEAQVATVTSDLRTYRHNFNFPQAATYVCYYVYLGSLQSAQQCNQVITPASLVLSATSVTTGASITVTVNGGNADPTQWVAMYLAGNADSAWSYNGNWQYLNRTQTAPTAAVTKPVTLNFTAPAEAGIYNFRYFANTGFGTRLAISQNLTVTAPSPCATPGTCDVVLTWNPSDTTAGGVPRGYKVYYGPTSRGYTTSFDTNLNLTYSIPNFVGGRTYYFAVSAYNNAGESAFSNEVWKAFPSCCTGGTFTIQLR